MGSSSSPGGAEHEAPQTIRLCYSEVAPRDRAAAVFAASDSVEPVVAWRGYRRELSKQDWDYDPRRLFFCSTSDITGRPFSKGIESPARGLRSSAPG
jgi:hypothetical protein